MTSIIGSRIKFFRQRAKLSQMELELKMDAAFGTISRIESGKITPTNETIIKISTSLNLPDIEVDYINGKSTYIATQQECLAAAAEVKEYFSKKGVLAYLLDDRYRMISISNDFLKFLNITEEKKDKLMIGRAFICMVLDKELGIMDRLNKKEDIMEHLLERFYSEVGFMVDDKFYNDSIKCINSNPMMHELWNKIISKPPVNLQTLSSRIVNFKYLGINVPLHYSNEFLKKNKRFQMIEYTPTNKLISILSRL